MKKTKRREFLKIVGQGISYYSIASILPGIGCQSAAKRPNILFIMSDDHGTGALSCYGSKINVTPHLDRLAKEGIKFNNCFCTNSLCAPSRAVIQTGKYSHLNGVLNNRSEFDGSQQTVSKLLQQAGYQTALIGKWHLQSPPTGFDYWYILPGLGEYINPHFYKMGEKIERKGYVTDLITDETINWIEQRDLDRPFFVMCHHKAPHGVHISDEKHKHLYNDELPVPDTFYDDHATRSSAARKKMRWTSLIDMKKNHLLKDPPQGLTDEELKKWNYQEHFQGYLKVVAAMDDNIGRLLDYLDESHLTQNTVVIYTTDNGFFLGDHGWFNKMWMYEESIRLPLLIRYPKEIKSGSVSDNMVLNLDFAPTFLDYANAKIPEDMQGRSFRKVLQGKTPGDWRNSFYYHYYGDYDVAAHYGIRNYTHKLIYFYQQDEWELYDLEKDPKEMINVYADPKYTGIIKELKKDLIEIRNKYQDH